MSAMDVYVVVNCYNAAVIMEQFGSIVTMPIGICSFAAFRIPSLLLSTVWWRLYIFPSMALPNVLEFEWDFESKTKILFVNI